MNLVLQPTNSFMKKLALQLSAVALASVLLAFNVIAAESLSVLLPKGIFAEETEGNLDAAKVNSQGPL